MRIANGVVAVSIVASAMMSACAGARAGSPPWPAPALVTTSSHRPVAREVRGAERRAVSCGFRRLRTRRPLPPSCSSCVRSPPVVTRPLVDRIVFWDAGAPGYRWNGILADELFKRNLSGATSSRQIALVQVAIYDATIAAWDSKYAYRRPRPVTADPALATAIATPRGAPFNPSEQAAVAGAAAPVLAYLFPDRADALTAQAEEAARSRELAGVQYPSDTAAGLELGRKVADLVIERASRDGSELPWTGSVPAEAGKLSLARYPAGAAPLGASFGTYKTWVLTSGSELRPGPPPAFDSPEKAAEVAEVVNFPRTFLTNAAAFYWQTPKGTTTHWMLAADQKIFEYRLDTNPPRAARVQALMSVASYDAAVACWDAKYTYWAMRPFHYDPRFTPPIPVPQHPSYPAAHGCYSGSGGRGARVSVPA